ncbi:XRE family transcriptional regulator [Pseudotabrizicola sediminis]|uniref:XRE family transcriptional regulator n=1 Tax=Pseudotabrizicola sediminis TaxID=2486418 RepID=A0ABY2KKE6_9RHOB|nr:XRE family transcriptional regulator [Pseudotabrizicola sediminis]
MRAARIATTGAALKASRKAAGLTQRALAQLSGVSREAVQYWEAKNTVPLKWGAPRSFAKVLELPTLADLIPHNARAGGWGDTQKRDERARIDAWVEAQMVLWREREAQRKARCRVVCGAKTRKGGECRNKSEAGRRRCKFHGGKSTGARTPDGKERIAGAQRRRWAAWRANGLQ